MTAEGRFNRPRLIVLGISGILLLIVAGVVLASGLFAEKPARKERLAFGKLPLPARSANETQQMQGMPASDGAYSQPEFDYKWTGGDWPDLPGAMVVYRRSARKIDLAEAEAKALAAKFGLTGEPEPVEPVMPMGAGGQSVGGSSGAGSEPAPDGVQTEPAPGQTAPAPGGEAGAPPVGEDEAPPAPRVEAPDDQQVAEQPKYYRFYDQADGKSLEIYEAAGRFSYQDETVSQEVQKSSGEGPSKTVAQKAAIDFLEAKGLLLPERLGPFFGPGGVVSTGVVSPDGAEPAATEPRITEPPYMEVNFGRKLGLFELVEFGGEVNQYVISVTVGPNGLIMGASGEIPSTLDESEYPLISPETALAKIEDGSYFGGPAALGAPEPMLAPVEPPVTVDIGKDLAEPPATETGTPVKPAPVIVEIDRVKLGYLSTADETGLTFYVPAYIFSGKTAGAEGGAFSTAIPAVSATYLEN